MTIIAEINWQDKFKMLLQAIIERCDGNTYADVVEYMVEENNLEEDEATYINEIATSIFYEAYDSEMYRYVPDDIELTFRD